MHCEIGSIWNPGDVYNLGTVVPLCTDATQNLKTVLSDLLAFAGAASFVTPSGQIRIVQENKIPSSDSSLRYSSDSPGNGDYRIENARRIITSFEGIVKSTTASGQPLTSTDADGNAVSVEAATATWIASGIKGKADTFSNPYIQTMDQASAIAERETRKHARNDRTIELDVPLDPDVLPGKTCVAKCSFIELNSATPAYIVASRTNGVGMTLSCSTGPSLTDGAIDGLPPQALFTIRIDAESVLVNGVASPRYFVFVDGSGSTDSDGTIASYGWAIAGATAAPDPATITTPHATFVLDKVAGASITLTVTDNIGLTATQTQALDGPQTPALTRLLSVAALAQGWRIMPDSTGWKSFILAGVNCINVPSFNEKGPLVALFANGTVYTTADNLATPATLLATVGAGAATGCIFVNEADGTDMVVSLGPRLYRSRDAGKTWALIHTAPETIFDVQLTNQKNTNVLRLTRGASAYVSYDNGASWTQTAPFTGTATARQFASAPWNHAVVAEGTPDAALKFEEAGAITWTGTAPASLTALTPLLATEGYVAGDATGKLYSILKNASGGFDGAQLATGVTGRVDDVLRDGLFGGPGSKGIVFGTGAGGTFKQVDLASIYPLDTTPGLSIGYGKYGLPILTGEAEVIIPPFGASGADDFFWHFVPGGTGWVGVTPPRPGWKWYGVVADPKNADRWATWGCLNPAWQDGAAFKNNKARVATSATATGDDSPIWITDNAGQTWTPIDLQLPNNRVYQPVASGNDQHSERWPQIVANLRILDTRLVFDRDTTALLIVANVHGYPPNAIDLSTFVIWEVRSTPATGFQPMLYNNTLYGVLTPHIAPGKNGGYGLRAGPPNNTWWQMGKGGIDPMQQTFVAGGVVPATFDDSLAPDMIFYAAGKKLYGGNYRAVGSFQNLQKDYTGVTPDIGFDVATAQQVPMSSISVATDSLYGIYVAGAKRAIKISTVDYNNVTVSVLPTVVGAPNTTLLSPPRVDRQTRSKVVIRYWKGFYVEVADGVWAYNGCPLVTDYTKMSPYIEVVVRTPQ